LKDQTSSQSTYLRSKRVQTTGATSDDPVHRVFGFSDLEFQSLYHFTIGGPVEDSRLTTLAPYDAHEEEELRRRADRA
jgi:hypothetical protein